MEYTEKLGLPIPAVTRGGDANDVVDITTTIGQLLNYIDAGTGDNTVAGANPGAELDTITGGDTEFSAILLNGSELISPGRPDGYDEDKIGWSLEAETDYAKINTDGSILIKAAGNYNIIPQVHYSVSTGTGDIFAYVTRDDAQTQVNESRVFSFGFPITGSPMAYARSNNTISTLIGVIGPHFYQAGATVTPAVYLTDPTAELETYGLGIAVERL